MESKEFLYNMCWKLTKVISITDRIAAGAFVFSELDKATCFSLAGQFAEVKAITDACAQVARRRELSPMVVEMYEGFSCVYGAHAIECGIRSGKFTTAEALEGHLAHLTILAANGLGEDQIEADKMFAAAQDAVAAMSGGASGLENDSWWQFEQNVELLKRGRSV